MNLGNTIIMPEGGRRVYLRWDTFEGIVNQIGYS